MAIFDIGPDGLLLVEALVVSAIIALLAWRRVGLKSAVTVTGVVALAWVMLQAWYDASHPDQVASRTLTVHVIVAMFTIVPSALLLGASRLRWLARRSWVLLLVGPVLFVGCFVGICEVCAKAGLLGS
jgi:hypothetical protein